MVWEGRCGMYTLEQKTRAVEPCVKYGKRGAAVRRELGYPKSRQQLLAWFREWEANGGSFREPGHAKYTEEQKRTAVEHYLAHGKCEVYRFFGHPMER